MIPRSSCLGFLSAFLSGNLFPNLFQNPLTPTTDFLMQYASVRLFGPDVNSRFDAVTNVVMEVSAEPKVLEHSTLNPSPDLHSISAPFLQSQAVVLMLYHWFRTSEGREGLQPP